MKELLKEPFSTMDIDNNSTIATQPVDGVDEMDNGERGMPLPTYLTSISNKNKGLIISDISEEENEEGNGSDSDDDDDDAVLNLNEQ